jgi:hypothetical protein
MRKGNDKLFLHFSFTQLLCPLNYIRMNLGGLSSCR